MKTLLHNAPWVGALMAASATFMCQTTVHAQSCTDDADCSAGYACKTQSYESCWGSYGCDENGECTYESDCTTVEESYCSNATCGSDSDCPDHMACQEQITWVCDGGSAGGGSGAGGAAGTGVTGGSGGAAGGVCEDGMCEAPTCEEVPADSLCIPRHQLPCEEASDCGGGFDCVESTYWSCMGGGAAGAAGTGAAGVGGASMGGSGGSADPDQPDDVVCEELPSGTSWCHLQDLPCEDDADCPAGLECGEQYIYGPCMGGVGGMFGEAGTAGSSSGGAGGSTDEDPIVCPEPELQHRCMPSAYEGGGAGMGGAGMGGAGVGGAGGSPSGSGGSAAGEGGGEMGGASGMSAAGGAGGGAGGDDGEGEPDESDDKPKHGKKLGWLKKLLRGCSTTGPTSSAGGMSWLVLGLAALALRRRARKA